jgi:2-oxoisovalerate dehydrogenase E1 component
LEIKEILKQVESYGEAGAYVKDRDKPLKDYAGLTASELEHIFDVMVKSRRILIEEKLLTRRGESYFFIGSSGKELIDACTGHFLRPNDPFFGYYRNKTLDIYRGIDIRQKMLECVGDPRSVSTGGMLQHAHSAHAKESIMPQASPTGAHSLEAAGVGSAIGNPSPISAQSRYPGGRWPADAISYCSIGEGSTSEAEFARAVFYSVFNKSRNIFAIYNCGWAISVSVEEQFPEGDPTSPFEGYQRFGLKIDHFDGTEIKEVLKHLKENVEYCRAGKGSVLEEIKVVREESHSGSDDQSFYMALADQKWHYTNDPVLKTAKTLIHDGILTSEQVKQIYDKYDAEVSRISAEVVADRQLKTREYVESLVFGYDFDKAKARWHQIVSSYTGDRNKELKAHHANGARPSPELPENQGPMTLRRAMNNALFDLFLLTPDAVTFGEDVADFSGELKSNVEAQKTLKGKGGVFLLTQGLQRAFGPNRVYNTPLDEAGILGHAMGHAYQGRIALPEIQFLDYMSPAYQQLKDRIATLHQRSKGQELANIVIRCSYGGYKQGAGSFWHSEANLGTFINIPGLHVVCASNPEDAVGLFRTAVSCGDPVLFCEAVALYNRREWDGIKIERPYPPLDFMIPFGQAKIYAPEKKDIAIISYGITLPMCLRAAELLAEKGINARVIDLRTLKPMDTDTIRQSAKECNRVLVVSEDRFPGGIAPTISAVITSSDAFGYLDAPIGMITALDARVAYGPDGDRACLPQLEQIIAEAEKIVAY